MTSKEYLVHFREHFSERYPLHKFYTLFGERRFKFMWNFKSSREVMRTTKQIKVKALSTYAATT